MRRVCALAVLAGLLLLAGCSRKGEEGTAASPSLKEKIEAQVGAAAPAVELARAWANMHQAKSWRQRMLVQGGKGDTLVEVSCPDKEHMTSTLGKQSFESIHIGNDSWARIAGRWMKLPATRAAVGMCPGAQPQASSAPGGGMPGGGSSGGASSKGMTDLFKDLQKAKITVGSMQTVEGAACQEYLITLAADPSQGRDQDITTNVCVGVSDHLVRRIIMGDATITYWDWNQPIDISPPAM